MEIVYRRTCLNNSYYEKKKKNCTKIDETTLSDIAKNC